MDRQIYKYIDTAYILKNLQEVKWEENKQRNVTGQKVLKLKETNKKSGLNKAL